MSSARGDSSAGVAYALVAYAIWGVTPVYWKAVDALPAPELLAQRVLWAFATGALLIGLSRSAADLRALVIAPRRLLPVFAAALLIGTNWLVFIWAVNSGRILATSLGYYINPLISVLLGTLLLRERLRPLQRAAVVLAALGVAQIAFALDELPWIALVLSVSFALYGLVRKVAAVPPLAGFCLETAILAPAAAAYVALLWGRGESTFPLGGIAPNLLVVAAGPLTAAPLVCFASAAKRLRLSSLGLFQYIAPSLAFVLAVAVYDEPFTRAHAITFACVWTALLLYSLDSIRAAYGR